jgi:hypothetical protein
MSKPAETLSSLTSCISKERTISINSIDPCNAGHCLNNIPRFKFMSNSSELVVYNFFCQLLLYYTTSSSRMSMSMTRRRTIRLSNWNFVRFGPGWNFGLQSRRRLRFNGMYISYELTQVVDARAWTVVSLRLQPLSIWPTAMSIVEH